MQLLNITRAETQAILGQVLAPDGAISLNRQPFIAFGQAARTGVLQIHLLARPATGEVAPRRYLRP